MDTTPRDVLEFWFGAEGSPERGQPRGVWFRKDPAFDESIRARFGGAVEAALAGAFADWDAVADGALARVVLLDQFTRNIHRDTPRAFAGDAKALALARSLVAAGQDRTLGPYERWFVYLPFEHAESLAAQDESVRLYTQLAQDGWPDALTWAKKHYDVIARFGRFPHRNDILRRASTPEEVEFLKQPGSRF